MSLQIASTTPMHAALCSYWCAVVFADQAKRLDDAKNVKLRQLEQNNRGITDFARWVEKSRADGLFRGAVLGPILLEVSVPDAQHAKYVEQQLPSEFKVSR